MFRIFYLGGVWLIEGLVLLCMPFLRLKSKYTHSLPARFLLVGNKIPDSFLEFDYWFHSCSLGETASLKFIMEELKARNQPLKILLTTTTQTGFKQALNFQEQIFSHSSIECLVRYLPFEPLLRFWVKPTKKLFVLEAELWHELLFCAKQRGAEVCLLNARISTKSYPKYLYFKRFYQQLFKYVDQVFAQSLQDKERLESLGASCVSVIGNLKLLNPPHITQKFSPTKRPLVVLASTHSGEESLIFEHFTKHYASLKPSFTLLVIVRHPERFDEVWALMARYFPHYIRKRRSQDSDFLESDIALIDSMGESLEFYSIATAVVLCGSFLPIGGHNPIEVAYFNKPLLSGSEIFNQIPLFESVEGYEIVSVPELMDKLDHLDTLKPTRIKHAMKAEDVFELIFKDSTWKKPISS